MEIIVSDWNYEIACGQPLDLGRHWAVIETYSSSARGVVGNAAEGSNAHVCLDSPAWCQ